MDGMWTELFKPHITRVHPCELEEVKHSKQKELRIIDTLEPVISGHKLIVAASVISKDFQSTREYPTETAHKYQLFWQMSHITRDKGSLGHDDRLDALAIAVAYWVEQMSQDVNRNIRDREEREFMLELETFTGNLRQRGGIGGSQQQEHKHIGELLADAHGFDKTLVQLGIQENYVIGLGMTASDHHTHNCPRWVNSSFY